MSSVAVRMSLSGCRRRTPRPQRCSEASSRSWEGMTMTMTSRPLNPTGPDALTKPNPNYGPANWTNFGPDWPKYGPCLSQAHGTLIVTDYPPSHPPYLSPIPPICGDKYEVCSSTFHRTVILMSFSFLKSLNKELLLHPILMYQYQYQYQCQYQYLQCRFYINIRHIINNC